MNKKKKQEEVDQSKIIASEITKTIMDYCYKQDSPVSMTYIVKALSDVLAAHLATMTGEWSESEEKKVVGMIFDHIVSTMKECKNSLDEDKHPAN